MSRHRSRTEHSNFFRWPGEGVRSGPFSSFSAAALTLVFLAVAALGGPAAAQDTGTITGTVVNQAAGQPLADVQIAIQGTGLGTLSNQSGRFIILNVPVGTHTLRAERIGFGAVEEQVSVTAGETLEVDLTLQSQALGLDELVVTGTAGAARRREIGNSISQLSSQDIREPPQNVDALLQGRVAGMTVTQQSGMVGDGAQIRLRGVTSLSQSNQPLIYVDGVRMRSDGLSRNVPPVGFQGRSGNNQASPLNNINPQDIDRIEVIKGSAATTLYGSEASAGVIQIFTKRGSQGAARWTAQIDQGVNWTKEFGVDRSKAPPSEATQIPSPAGGTPEFMFIDPWLKNAHTQNYSISVTGGTETARYFLSGSFADNEGVLPNDEQEKFNVRGNFGFTPREDLQIDWNTSFTRDDTQNTPAGNNAHGLTLNAFRRDRNYRGEATREAIDPILDYDIDTEINQLTTGLTATYTPLTEFTNRFTVGWDQIQQNNRNFRPFGFALAPFGIVSDQRSEFSTLTVDYVGTLNFDVPFLSDLGSSLSFGGESITKKVNTTTAHGENFPGPGDPVVSNAGDRLGFESRERVLNAGFFFQNVLDYQDKYFITGGVRVDGNSAFGEGLGIEAYPKVSVSYVVSDEDFWPSEWGSLKLRGAWGQSGRAPGAFDSRRTFEAAGFGPDPAFLPDNVGNPNLAPEVTKEGELGFDLSTLSDRLTIDFTAFRQKTSDALFPVRQIPSLGFTGTQLENVGVIVNKGIELGWDAVLIERPNWTWNFGGSLALNKSRVRSLGGAAEFGLGGNLWAVEGRPAPVVRGDCVTNPNEFADPIVETNCDFGSNEPVRILQGNTSLRLPWNGITLSARGEYQGGMWINNGAASAAISRSVIWPGCFGTLTTFETQGREAVRAGERARCLDISNFRGGFTIARADFFKLREITATIPIPAGWVPQADQATFTVSARNLVRWTHDSLKTMDPEIGFRGFSETFGRQIAEHVPPPASVTFSVRVTY